jgi:hypothetical protein
MSAAEGNAMRKLAGITAAGIALALCPAATALAVTGPGRVPGAESPAPARLIPDGTGEPIASLNAMTANASLAVGTDSISTFLDPLCGTDLSERRGRTGFSALKTPSPSCGWLDSVVSLPRGRAWAVGYLTTRTGADHTLTEYYNGSHWKIEASPNPGRENVLAAVTATRSGTVWAVGSNLSGSLIFKRAGSGWTPVANSLKVDLHAITVTASGQVWAAGDFYDPDLFNVGTAIVHLTASGWKQVPSPDPGQGNGSHLDGIVAGPHGALWAVGYYDDPNTDVARSLTLRYDGGTWTQVASPSPGTQADFLYSVAAGASGDMWAVGGYTGPRCERNLVEHFADGAWHVVKVPNRGSCPNGTNAFYGVTVAGGKVYAVGQAGIDALAEERSGSTWKVLKASN